MIDPGRLAFGCCPLGGHGWSEVNVAEVQRAIGVAFERGITTFDTADVYGFGASEKRLSEALGNQRHRARIVTKVGLRRDTGGAVVRDGTAEHITRAVQASLRRMRLETIPVVLLHWPDPLVPVTESLGALAELQVRGDILAHGASNLGASDPIVPYSQHHVSLLTGPLPAVLRGCELTMAWGTLEQGLLTRRNRKRGSLADDDRRQRLPSWEPRHEEAMRSLLETLHRLARVTGGTPAALAVRWVLERGGVDVAVVGIKSVSQLRDLIDDDHVPAAVEFESLAMAARPACSQVGSKFDN